MSKDPISDSLQSLSGSLPNPRLNLTEAEKDALIAAIGGPKTAQAIITAKKELPLSRIPFLFSSLNTQAVVDILYNDVSDAISRARRR